MNAPYMRLIYLVFGIRYWPDIETVVEHGSYILFLLSKAKCSNTRGIWLEMFCSKLKDDIPFMSVKKNYNLQTFFKVFVQF